MTNNWVECKLEDCVDILDSLRIPINNTDRQTRIKGKSHNELYPYYGATGQVGVIDDYIFEEELVALGEDGAPFLEQSKPKAYMLRGKTWVNNHAHVLRANRNLTSNKFLLYYLNQFNYQGYVNGGTRLKLTQGNMRKIPIFLPALAEQTRIAEKLDELLAQVDTLKARIDRIPAILKRFRQSVLAAAASGKLTEKWRDQMDITSSIQVFELGNIAKFIDYRGKTPTKVENGVPLITAKNIRHGYISREPREYIRVEDYDNWMTRGIPKEGDVLITTEAPLGNVAIIDIKEKFALAQRAICLSVIVEDVSSKYLALILQSPQFQQELWKRATGTTVKGIKASVLKNMGVECPKLNEQTEIVRRVEQLFAYADQLEAAVNNARARIDRLTQSILAKAFRGELVPQDPNDEPASVLLERIRTERTAQTKPRRNQRKTAD